MSFRSTRTRPEARIAPASSATAAASSSCGRARARTARAWACSDVARISAPRSSRSTPHRRRERHPTRTGSWSRARPLSWNQGGATRAASPPTSPEPPRFFRAPRGPPASRTDPRTTERSPPVPSRAAVTAAPTPAIACRRAAPARRRTGTEGFPSPSRRAAASPGRCMSATASATCRARSLSTGRSRRCCTTGSRPAAAPRSTARDFPSRGIRWRSSSPKASPGCGELIPSTGNVYTPTGPASGVPYNCSPGGQSVYTDVSPTDSFCKHVHYAAAKNVASGCTATEYCPGQTVTRDAMASFLARALAVALGGASSVPLTYGPDPATGRSYSCDAGSPNLHFTDVPASNAVVQAHPLSLGQGNRQWLHGDTVLPWPARHPRRHGEVHRQRVRTGALRAVDKAGLEQARAASRR